MATILLWFDLKYLVEPKPKKRLVLLLAILEALQAFNDNQAL